MKMLATVALSLLLTACAAPPARIAETESGWPEITIATQDRSGLRANLIARNLATGWTLESESESMLLFTKIDTSTGGAVMQALIGNAYSTPPKYEARYVMVPTAGGLKLVVNVAVSTQMPGGQVNRQPLDGAPTFNSFQAQLQRLKAEFERS